MKSKMRWAVHVAGMKKKVLDNFVKKLEGRTLFEISECKRQNNIKIVLNIYDLKLWSG
jgi:hypothetical protein